MGISASSNSDLNNIIQSVYPDALQRLREKYPEQESLFSLYKELGEDDGQHAQFSLEAQQEYAQLAASANHTRLAALLERTRKRLIQIQIGRTVGVLATGVLGIITALMAYFDVPKTFTALLAGIITPLTALSTKLLDLRGRSPTGEQLADPLKYAELAQLDVENDKLQEELQVTPFNQPSRDSLAKTYAALQEVAKGLRKFEKIGV